MLPESNITLLVLSCDKYSKLWPLFVKRFNRHWESFGGDRLLLTNHAQGEIDGFGLLSVGDDIGWSQNLAEGLKSITTDYVFIMLEDTPISRPVDNGLFTRLMAFATENDVDYINTKALPMPTGERKGLVSVVDKGAHYRASLCNAIWRTEYLKQLVRPDESPWEFEINASVRCNESDGFYGTRTPLVVFDHVLIRGKLTRDVLKIEDIRDSNLVQSFDVMSRRDFWIHKLKLIRNQMFTRLVSPKWQQKIRAMW